jgi:membrane complex biogenesis BtpA family protein
MNKNKLVIGMVHLGALPGTPQSRHCVSELAERAVAEAELLDSCGFDGIILENMHDVPYLNRQVGAEIVSAFSVIAAGVRRITDLPLGIQVLAGANQAALAIASACDLNFIRAEGYVFSQISDEGLMNSDAGELLRYRRNIGAENIKIFCDIKKKHSSHAVTADIPVADMAKAAEFFLADGVIITGVSTGEPASIQDLDSTRQAVNCPVWIGSGLTADNIADYWQQADGFITGSWLKHNGVWSNPLSKDRCCTFMDKIHQLKNPE